MNKYQRGKIYKIISNITNDVYVGSTCEKYLSSRLSGHRRNYGYYKLGRFNYITSFKILETGNYDIILIENYPCESKNELFARERYWMENTKNCLNQKLPCTSEDEKKEYRKQYKIDHKEYISITGKQYREANMKKIQEARKQYREVNKEIIKQQKQIKIKCICGSTYRSDKKWRHFKSRDHIKWAKVERQWLESQTQNLNHDMSQRMSQFNIYQSI